MVRTEYVLRSDKWRKSPRTLYNKPIVEHLNEDVHVLKTVGAVDTGVHNCFIPSLVGVFGSCVEFAILAKSGEFS